MYTAIIFVFTLLLTLLLISENSVWLSWSVKSVDTTASPYASMCGTGSLAKLVQARNIV